MEPSFLLNTQVRFEQSAVQRTGMIKQSQRLRSSHRHPHLQQEILCPCEDNNNQWWLWLYSWNVLGLFTKFLASYALLRFHLGSYCPDENNYRYNLKSSCSLALLVLYRELFLRSSVVAFLYQIYKFQSILIRTTNIARSWFASSAIFLQHHHKTRSWTLEFGVELRCAKINFACAPHIQN